MSKPLKRFLVFCLVLQFIIPYPAFAAAVGEFTSVIGNVTQTREGKVIRPVVKSPIMLKDFIVTGDNSSATMVFSDDSIIKLDANSKFEVMEFSQTEKARKGVFSLELGKVTCNVKKFIGGDNVFQVKSPTATAGVRGTFFVVAVAIVGGVPATTVTCTAGALSISALSVTGAVVSTATLAAGQSAIITSAGITISAAGAAAGAATTTAGATTTTGAAATTTGAAAAGATAGTTVAAGVGVGTVAAAAAVTATVVAATLETVAADTPTAHPPATTAAHH